MSRFATLPRIVQPLGQSSITAHFRLRGPCSPPQRTGILQTMTVNSRIRASWISACFALPLVCLAALAQPRATAQTPAHPPLLPRVQNLQYGSGSLQLCRLSFAPASGEDTQAVAQLQQILHSHCPSPTSPSLPIALLHDEPSGNLPGTDDHASPTSRESYTITISSTGVRLHGRTATGVFYSVQTLRQLIEPSATGPQLPFVEIEDWPSLPYRGFMMDMSHGAVLTVDEVKRQLDALSQFKANQYFFYTETAIDLAGYPLLHQDSNWTPAEVRSVVDYARDRQQQREERQN